MSSGVEGDIGLSSGVEGEVGRLSGDVDSIPEIWELKWVKRGVG